MRDKGYRPHTGLWHRKDGYCGRKIKPPKALKVLGMPEKPKPRVIPYTYENWSLTE
jgi:hypothetical protein